MKKIKYLVVTLAVLIGFASCEDAYEIEPIGIMDEDATFISVENAQTYLNGLYSELGGGVTTAISFTTIFTDEVAPSFDWNGSNRSLHQMILNSTSGHPEAMWYSYHRAVNRANRLIVGAELIETNDPVEQAQLKNIVAQARFIRANAYINLSSYFSTDMTDDSALSGMFFTHIPESDEEIARGTNGEVFGLVVDDLTYAIANLNNDGPFIYITKSAAEALMARMYAYRGMYPQAKTHALNVINNSGLSLTVASPYEPNNFYHPINSSNPYRQIWSDIPVGNPTQHENILSLQSLIGSGAVPQYQPAGVYFQNSTRCSGNPLWAMSYKLYDMYAADENDIRLYAFVDPTTHQGCGDGEVVIDKYPGLPGGSLINNLKLIRLSEMYFLLAEAYVAEDNLGEAAKQIQKVRQARAIDGNAGLPTYGSKADAWKDILKERRKELFAEGFRYIDLKRLGNKAGVSIDRDAKDVEFSSDPLTLPLDDHRWTLPVPFYDMSINSLLVQNPGY